jgi:GNAT superfamily N-acetyltransferase
VARSGGGPAAAGDETAVPHRVPPAGLYLVGLVVAADRRRLGVGRAITVASTAWALEREPEVWYFANARNRASLDLHTELGYEEVTRDFEVPGLTFAGGVGVLCRATRGT